MNTKKIYFYNSTSLIFWKNYLDYKS